MATVRRSPRSGRVHNSIKKPKESKISEILEERRRGRGWQYKVIWDGEDSNSWSWLPGTALKVDGREALTAWEQEKQLTKKALTL